MTKDSRPNIIFLMPDQMRWDFVGAYGAPHARTPNMDALAARGTVFERCLSPSPVCIPARASMLTGHNPLSTGVLDNNHWLRPDHDACGVPSFATLLSRAGYHTEAIGKMHFIPWDSAEGFDHRVIAEDKRHIHIRDDYHDYLERNGLRKYAGAEEPGYVEGRMASISLVPAEHQVDAWVGNHSVDFLERHDGDGPFFLWAAFPGPHDPYNPTPDLLAQVTEDMPEAFAATPETEPFRPGMIEAHLKGSSGVDISDFDDATKLRIRRHYQALIRLIDAQVGAIVAAAEARDDGRETLIVLSSDHGDFLGDFDFLGKVLFHESSMRVPMIVAGAGTPVARSDALVSLTDVFATFCAAARVPAACQDSLPLPGIGLGDKRRGHLMGATDKGYCIADARWKLSRYRNGVCTLHDIVEDPREQHNRWSDPACSDLREALDRKLTAWLIASAMDGHKDKSYPYMTMTPDHPGHGRGWKRTYPADPWSGDLPRGLH
ncbi:sulfatase family protein [Oceaniglobus trochenteri]|uniref:sulfatase family protein n=1 Tax=Oceaniglobus trochenteri TaxID=2763260 RepID=UPI001CFFCC3E|nr:sulfatase-like hydrolase/transferase [Oceaniglobus trochenteri]